MSLLAQITESVSIEWSIQTWALVLGGIGSVLLAIWKATNRVTNSIASLSNETKEINAEIKTIKTDVTALRTEAHNATVLATATQSGFAQLDKRMDQADRRLNQHGDALKQLGACTSTGRVESSN